MLNVNGFEIVCNCDDKTYTRRIYGRYYHCEWNNNNLTKLPANPGHKSICNIYIVIPRRVGFRRRHCYRETIGGQFYRCCDLGLSTIGDVNSITIHTRTQEWSINEIVQTLLTSVVVLAGHILKPVFEVEVSANTDDTDRSNKVVANSQVIHQVLLTTIPSFLTVNSTLPNPYDSTPP